MTPPWTSKQKRAARFGIVEEGCDDIGGKMMTVRHGHHRIALQPFHGLAFGSHIDAVVRVQK
jgi:hypothetical protein